MKKLTFITNNRFIKIILLVAIVIIVFYLMELILVIHVERTRGISSFYACIEDLGYLQMYMQETADKYSTENVGYVYESSKDINKLCTVIGVRSNYMINVVGEPHPCNVYLIDTFISRGCKSDRGDNPWSWNKDIIWDKSNNTYKITTVSKGSNFKIIVTPDYIRPTKEDYQKCRNQGIFKTMNCMKEIVGR